MLKLDARLAPEVKAQLTLNIDDLSTEAYGELRELFKDAAKLQGLDYSLLEAWNLSASFSTTKTRS